MSGLDGKYPEKEALPLVKTSKESRGYLDYC